jgi:hypothetical protein
MAVKKALIIKGGLQWQTLNGDRAADVIVTVSEDAQCIEIKTPQDTIIVSVTDLEAIQQLVTETSKAGEGNCLTITGDGGLLLDALDWQLDWSGISHQVRFIAKDSNDQAYGYASRPKRGVSMWHSIDHCWRMVGLDDQIPGDWRESLYERPE